MALLIFALLVTASGFSAASPLASQEVTGLVVDAYSGAPVVGVMVGLAPLGGTNWMWALTSASGEFRVRVGGVGWYQLRADRMGYAESVGDSLLVPADGIVGVAVRLQPQPISLEGIVVSPGKTTCNVSRESRDVLVQTWEAVRKALAAAELSLVLPSGMAFMVESHVRRLDSRGRIIEEVTDTVLSTAVHAFYATSVEHLAANGWSEATADSTGTIYHGPDPEVLLSPWFESNHCFTLEAAQPDGTLPLSFRSAAGGEEGRGIKGVFYWDSPRARLDRIHFVFDRPPGVPVAEAPAGELRFELMESGHLVVSEWWIRVPETAPARVRYQEGVRGFVRQGPALRVIGYSERGGRVLSVLYPNREGRD